MWGPGGRGSGGVEGQRAVGVAAGNHRQPSPTGTRHSLSPTALTLDAIGLPQRQGRRRHLNLAHYPIIPNQLEGGRGGRVITQVPCAARCKRWQQRRKALARHSRTRRHRHQRAGGGGGGAAKHGAVGVLHALRCRRRRLLAHGGWQDGGTVDKQQGLSGGGAGRQSGQVFSKCCISSLIISQHGEDDGGRRIRQLRHAARDACALMRGGEGLGHRSRAVVHEQAGVAGHLSRLQVLLQARRHALRVEKDGSV